jgi:hypothetical protein
MLPAQLSDWDVDAIVNLLSTKMFESENFDYKEALPDPRDVEAKNRLCAACCAFANSSGGFLVFGIDDNKSKSPTDRLVGLDSDLDFPEHFGNFPRKCDPSVHWRFRNPALPLASGRVIHVVEVPKSWRAPHAYGEASKGWRFTKRTNKGNEDMSMEEIRLAFLGHYEKRLKLQLLRSELVTLKAIASDAFRDPIMLEKKGEYSLASFDITVVETTISDTYSITANYPSLLEKLSMIRLVARECNNKIQIFFGQLALPLSNLGNIIDFHNRWMKPKCEKMAETCGEAIRQLDILIAS